VRKEKRMREWVVPGVLLLAVTGLALWILMDPTDQGMLESDGQVTPVSDESPRPGTSTTAPGDVATSPRDAAVSTSPFSEEEAPVEPDPTPTKTVTVEVYTVDPESGDEKVMPDVEVWFLRRDPEVMKKVSFTINGGRKIEDVVREVGQAYRTGSDGRTEVPAEPNRSGLFVMIPGFLGTDDTGRGDDDLIRLRLEPTITVPVRVVDTDGAPVAGVPVSVVNAEGRPLGMAPLASDQEGTAECVIDARRWARGGGGQGTQVTLAIPLSEADAKTTAAPVDLSALPTEPITLVMPSVGSVVVEIDAPDNWNGEQVLVIMKRGSADGSEPRRRRSRSRDRWHASVEDGVARFHHVGIGVLWDFDVVDEGGFEAEAEGVAGPGHAGEEVRVVLSPERNDPVITFRVVDEEGAPRPGLDLQLDLTVRSENSSNSSGRSARTDGDGRVEYLVSREWRPSEKRTLLICQSTRNGREDLGHSHRLDLSRDLSSGVTDLGDLRLSPAPVFVSGVVVDEAGTPIEGARGSLQRQQVSRYGRNNERVHEYWTYAAGEKSGEISDAEGRFVIRSFELSEDLHRIKFSKSGFSHEEALEFTPGGTGLRVILRGAGQVHAQVLLPDGCGDSQLRAELRDQNAAEGETETAAAYVGSRQGKLSFESVPPGVYDLSLKVSHGVGKSLIQLRGLTVRAGESCADPRLDPIDLRDKIQAVDVLVVDSSGAPIEDASVNLTFERRSSGRRTGADGRRRLILPMDPSGFELRVRKDGFMAAVVKELRSEVRVTLEAAPSILVQVAPGALSGLGSHVLSVSLRPAIRKSGSLQQSTDSVDIVAGKDARISVAVPGSYRLRWTLWEVTGPGSRSGRRVKTASDQVLEILAQDRDRLVIAQLTAAEVRRSLDRK